MSKEWEQIVAKLEPSADRIAVQAEVVATISIAISLKRIADMMEPQPPRNEVRGFGNSSAEYGLRGRNVQNPDPGAK